MIENVLFDMDGTLLPMDLEKFIKLYLGAAGKMAAPYGMDPEALVKSIWGGTDAMMHNDGSVMNDVRFWDFFKAVHGEEMSKTMMEVFTRFYEHEFDVAKEGTWSNPKAVEVVNYLKEKGMNLVVATNPVFPEMAQIKRVKWAGLNWDDFQLVTHYENSHFCKPNPMYFSEILEKLNMKAEETLMIGNDAVEDVAALKCGIRTFIVVDCLMHGTIEDLEKQQIPHGTFDDLMKYLREELG